MVQELINEQTRIFCFLTEYGNLASAAENLQKYQPRVLMKRLPQILGFHEQ